MIKLYVRMIKKYRYFKAEWKACFKKDFFDSMNMLFFFLGTLLILIFYLNGTIELKDYISTEILFLTFIAILQYTKETFWLKQVQQKQLNHERKSLKYKRTLDLIYKFNSNIRDDFEYIMNPEFSIDLDPTNLSSEDLKYCIKYGSLPHNKRKPYSSFDRVMSFFEISGLMVKNNLIDNQIYFDYFRLVIKKTFNNTNVIKLLGRLTQIDSASWENAIYLRDLIVSIKR